MKRYLFKDEKNMVMRKGIAVTTIIKFLLGLLVLVILAYLVYSVFFAPPLSESDCRTKMTSWCSSCSLLAGGEAWSGGSEVGADLSKCASTHWGITLDATDDCTLHESDCAPFLP